MFALLDEWKLLPGLGMFLFGIFVMEDLLKLLSGRTFKVEQPHGQEPVAPAVRRNPPKLQSSFAKASDFAKASPDRSEDTRIPPRSGDRGFLRRRLMTRRHAGSRLLPMIDIGGLGLILLAQTLRCRRAGAGCVPRGAALDVF